MPAYAVASRTRRTPDRYSCSESTVRRQAVNAAAGACGFCEHEGGSARGDPARALSTPRALGERARQRRCNPAQATSSVLGARTPWRAGPAAASMQRRRRADRGARWGRGSGRAGRGEPSDLPLEWAHVARPRLGNRTAISDPSHCELSDPSIGHHSRCRQWRAFPEARCPRLTRRRALNGSPDIDASARAALPGRRRSRERWLTKLNLIVL